jgi:hypothetical protein
LTTEQQRKEDDDALSAFGKSTLTLAERRAAAKSTTPIKVRTRHTHDYIPWNSLISDESCVIGLSKQVGSCFTHLSPSATFDAHRRLTSNASLNWVNFFAHLSKPIIDSSSGGETYRFQCVFIFTE